MSGVARVLVRVFYILTQYDIGSFTSRQIVVLCGSCAVVNMTDVIESLKFGDLLGALGPTR